MNAPLSFICVEEPYDEHERELLRLLEARYRAYQEEIAPVVRLLAASRACKPVRVVLAPDIAWPIEEPLQ